MISQFSIKITIWTVFLANSLAQEAPTPAGEKPEYLKSTLDPLSGAKVTRITGDPGAVIPNIDARWNDVARHGYSKESAWNSDQSLILLRTHHGFPAMIFLDGKTYEPKFGRNNFPGSEMRWHPKRADIFFFVKGNQIGFWNPEDDTTELIETFASYSELKIGPWEGKLSNDGKVVALSGFNEGRPIAFAYHLSERRKYPDIDLSGIPAVDWVSVSASGKLIVLNGRLEGDKGDQTQVFDLSGKKVGKPWFEYGRPSHYDFAIDERGDDVAVGVSKSAPDDGRVIKRRLIDGEVTVLTDGGYAGHTSTRNLDRPGWAYVTYQYRGKDWPMFQDQVIAVKLDGSRTIERIAHLRSKRVDYLTEAHAVPSPDGEKVIWASAWESKNGRPLGCYLADHWKRLNGD